MLDLLSDLKTLPFIDMFFINGEFYAEVILDYVKVFPKVNVFYDLLLSGDPAKLKWITSYFSGVA